MAKQGAVRLSGRFPPGTEVRLVKVRDASVLRAEGGEEVGSKKVDKDGTVEFTSGVEPNARYFICGYADTYREVRVRGRERDEVTGVVEQPPIGFDRVRLSDGTWLDEPPEQHQKTPSGEVAPAPGQHQVPKGTVQRSDTPRGTAHPVDPKEKVPYRAQEDVRKGTVQMSDTPGYTDEITGREISGGRATELAVGPQRQEEVSKGTLQRSDTPTGVATPIPPGDAIEVQRVKESSEAKERRGDPARAAAEPIQGNKPVKGATQKQSADRHEKIAEEIREAAATPVTGPGAPVAEEGDDTSGLDAEGQPAQEDVAAASGVEPADKPAEPVRAPRRKSSKSTRSRTASKSTKAKEK